MAKIKEIIANQKGDIKNIFQRYAVTLAAANLLCILYVIFEIADYNEKPAGYILYTLLGILIGSFLWESILTEDGSGRKKRIILYVIAGIISLAFTWVGDVAYPEFSDKGKELFWKIVVFCILLCTGLGIYGIIRKSGMSFQKYVTGFVFGMIKLGAICFALNIGAFLLLEMIDTLIVSFDYWDAVEYIEILLAGAVYLPYILICMTDKKENRSKFVRGFVMYVLMPLVLAAFAIIYLYIFKIIATRHMPSNEVFSICAQLFAMGAVIWTMADSYRESNEKDSGGGGLYEKLIRNLKYIYAPFILLECYSIGVRIGQYGLTQERYFAVMFIIVQVIYIAWEPVMALAGRFKRKPSEKKAVGYEGMVFVGFLIYVIACLVPGINAEYMEYRSQRKIFEQKIGEVQNYFTDEYQNNIFIPDSDYEEAEDLYYEMRSIYRVLMGNVYGAEYMEEAYSIDELDSMFSYHTPVKDENWIYTSAYNDGAVFDIAGYDRLYKFEYSCMPKLPFEPEILIETEDKTLLISVQPKGIYEYFIQMNEDTEFGIYVESYIAEIDENYKIIVNQARFYYNKEEGIVKDVNMYGYILER